VTCEEESSTKASLKDAVKKKILPQIKKILENMKKDIRTGF